MPSDFNNVVKARSAREALVLHRQGPGDHRRRPGATPGSPTRATRRRAGGGPRSRRAGEVVELVDTPVGLPHSFIITADVDGERRLDRDRQGPGPGHRRGVLPGPEGPRRSTRTAPRRRGPASGAGAPRGADRVDRCRRDEGEVAMTTRDSSRWCSRLLPASWRSARAGRRGRRPPRDRTGSRSTTRQLLELVAKIDAAGVLRGPGDRAPEGRELRRDLGGRGALPRRQALQGALPRADGLHGAGARPPRAGGPRDGEGRLHRSDHGHGVGGHRGQEPRGGPRHPDAAGLAARGRGVERAGGLPEAEDPLRARGEQRQRPLGRLRATRSSSWPTRTRSGGSSARSTGPTATSRSGWR